MILLKINATGDAVNLMQELLNELGYSLKVNGKFDKPTEAAIKDFQKKNNLVVDGVVYTKTWVKLLNNTPVNMGIIENKCLKEADIVNLAARLGVESAVIKAVNAVESSGRGFLIDGNPKILFEGHIFWKELKKRGINPSGFTAGNEDILYEKWTTKFYKGGKAEYERLNKAINLINNNPEVTEAAYASASWGMFQIMGYHYQSLGFKEVIEFIGAMQLNEGEHLKIFGKFIEVNGLLKYLKAKQWDKFALRYNGEAYAKNKYDVKLQKSYAQYA